MPASRSSGLPDACSIRHFEDAGIAREETFVTNAVKHFKHEMRGKRRLHKRPNAYETERCKIWLEVERALIKPATIVALGATAARSLMGRAVTITKLRGRAQELADGTRLVVTVHPSSLLRIKDKAEKQTAYRHFVADLKQAAAACCAAQTLERTLRAPWRERRRAVPETSASPFRLVSTRRRPAACD